MASMAQPSGAVSDEQPSISSARSRSFTEEPSARAPPSGLRFAMDKNLMRVLNESALDVTDVGSASSLDLPTTLTSDRMRRRSEISRIRPLESPAMVEAIELPVITSGMSTAVHESDVSTAFGEDAVVAFAPVVAAKVSGGDPEVAPSFPSSLAPSVSMRAEDETNSTTPALSAAEKATQARKSMTHFLALCWCVFGMGWNDGTTGPMLPRIQEHYGIGFAIVSLIFVLSACGYVCGAVANIYLTDRFGFGKVLIIGSLFQLAAYIIISPAGPFPLMCCAFILIGFGLSVQNAHANGFVASLKRHSRTKMGYLHGSYGLGALVSPLVSTQFAKSNSRWSYHYIISAGVYVSISVLLWVVFRGRRQEEIMEEEGEISTEAEAIASNKYRQIMGLREVHFLSLFALIYVGVEVTLGGWSVTYIMEKRNGSENSGYISSGFFGGLMLGRVLLMWLNKKIGERLALFLYALLAIVLEVTVWLIPSLIENAIAVSFVGLLIGPMYPILMNHSTTILPRWLLTGCMGYIAGIGQAGSAVLPFLSGLLASKFGIASLQPFVVSMMSTLIVIWAIIPRARYVPM